MYKTPHMVKNPVIRLVVNLLGLAFTAAILGMVGVALVLYHYSLDLPDYTQLASYNPDTLTRLYAADGKLLAEYAVQKRIYVPLTSIPKRVSQAFISAEDKNFYTNTGIDVYGIARALRQNLRRFGTGNKSLSGGSTITQQVVKNFLLTREQRLSRKIKEAILAYRITQVYSKDRILELYLNEIYLGRGSYGVAESAVNFFNKSLDQLTIEESALLAAMPKEPAQLDPATHYDRALARRNAIINAMYEQHYITADEARAAIATPITLRVRDRTEMASADFFAEEVRRELAGKYGSDALYKGGLFVKTTLEPELQKYSDDALRHALVEFDRRHGYRAPVTHFPRFDDWQKQLAQFQEKRRVPLFDGEVLSVVIETGASKATVGFLDGKKGSIDRASIAWSSRKGLARGDVIIVAPSAEKGLFALHQIPEVNGALIVMDPHTGRVLAMSGGYSYGGTEFNRATQAHRQPGSAFKPFVYLSAMENGYTPASIVVDEAVELPQGPGMPVWRPANYHGDYLGPATLRTGLEKSRNAMTVRLSEMLGLPKIIEVAERFGIYDKLPQQYSIVLGAQETTLIRLSNAYSMLVNGGKKVSPWLIERIDDHNGKTILRRDSRPCTACKVDDLPVAMSSPPPLPADNRMQIVDTRVAYQMVSMLEGVAMHGTGAEAYHVLQRPIAGKTGTTNDSRDTWFVGFSPDLVAGIYVGYDQPQTLGRKETGASVALPGFIRFMQAALKDKPSTPFRVPSGIEFIKVDQSTGQIPYPGDTNKIVLEAFKEGEGPGNDVIPNNGVNGLPWLAQEPQYQFPAEEPPDQPQMREDAVAPGAGPGLAGGPAPKDPASGRYSGDHAGTGGLY